jgi:hypothetical protein
VKQVTDEVDNLFNGSNDDFWVEYLKYVKGEKNVDEETTTGERYRVTDLGGSNVTL